VRALMKSRGGQKGNTNAAKNKGYNDRLNVGCKAKDKINWKAKAKAEGEVFTDWVNKTLNRAVKESEDE